jgi:hypothetical protein
MEEYRGFVTIRADRFVLADDPGRTVRLKGSNFRTVETPGVVFAQWNEAAVDSTMADCAWLGCNCVRVYVPVDRPELWGHFEVFRAKAAGLGIRTYPCFVWDRPYAAAGTRDHASQREHLIEFIGQYARDPSILAYDIINEPEWFSHEAWHWRFEEEGGRRRLDWLLRIAEAIHRYDPRHPASVGFIFNYTWWTPEWARILLERMDFVDFHYYHRNYQRRGLAAAIREVKERTGKPILVGEFGQSSDPGWQKPPYEPTHDDATQRELYGHALEAVRSEGIVGCVQWCTCSHDDQDREDGENEYGVFRQDHSAKPAATAYRDGWVVPLFARAV